MFGGWISNVTDTVRNLQDAIRVWIGFDRMTYWLQLSGGLMRWTESTLLINLRIVLVQFKYYCCSINGNWCGWCRCICGATDLSIGKDRSRCGEHSPQPCWGYLATAVRKVAATILSTQGRNRWKILGRCRHITSESTVSSLSCVENVVRHLQ